MYVCEKNIRNNAQELIFIMVCLRISDINGIASNYVCAGGHLSSIVRVFSVFCLSYLGHVHIY